MVHWEDEVAVVVGSTEEVLVVVSEVAVVEVDPEVVVVVVPAKYAIEKAKEHKDGAQNIDWGNFVKGKF